MITRQMPTKAGTEIVKYGRNLTQPFGYAVCCGISIVLVLTPSHEAFPNTEFVFDSHLKLQLVLGLFKKLKHKRYLAVLNRSYFFHV